jgi:DNA repair protein RAD5
MPHQEYGVQWMRECEIRQRGGILADVMGLGKTVETLALIISDNLHTSNLIICPKSLLFQWKSEALKHSTMVDEDVHIYYGQNRKLNHDARITITTYNCITQDCKNDSELYQTDWHRVVLDEAHVIRNEKTQTAIAAKKLNRIYSWCLSGTPFNNKLDDIASLCDFIGAKPYNSKYWWARNKGKPQELELWKKSSLLRRDKSVLNLPTVWYETIYCDFSAYELKVYQSLLNTAKSVFINWFGNQKKLEEYALVLMQLTKLRQTCDHWMLCTNRQFIESIKEQGTCIFCGSNQEKNISQSNCQIHYFCKDCLPSKIKNCPFCIIVNTEVENGDIPHSVKTYKLIKMLLDERKVGKRRRTVLFSQWTGMLDILEHFCNKHKITYCRLDGKMSVKMRDQQVQKFRETDAELFLISLKAGAVGLNLTCADRVILFDPWFNPFIEQQAIDRVHRIGQTKPINVVRFKVKHSIEDWMEQVQKRKEKISQVVVGSSSFQMQSAEGNGIKTNDIMSLFNHFTVRKPETISDNFVINLVE